MHWVALQPQTEDALSNQPGSPPVEPGADPGAVPGQVPADALSDALVALGWWALQFTPKVARLDQALVLEVSASERLWGGAAPLLHQLFKSNKPVAHVKYARGATSLIAVARLHGTGLARTGADDLPLAALAAARPHLGTLARLGCTHWGQLRALPRGGVVRRFGAPLLDALDRAYGLQAELYPWLVLPDVFQASLELSAQVETAPALLFGARRLFNQLQLWLQLRHRAVLAIELGWTLDARRDTATQGALVLRSAEPASDMAHLQRLLGEQLAHLTLPAPVLYLHLRTLETQQRAGETASLLPDEVRRGDSLTQLLERLAARLGPQQVLQMQARADHRPERMQVWQGVTDAAKLVAHEADNTRAGGLKRLNCEALYPTWLLAAPLKLAVRHQQPLYQGPLTLLAGPQRIETAWWDDGDCALRDYFLARSAQAGLLWVFRERLAGPGGAAGRADAGPDWYLHGLFA